jgi:sRNA-binding carbon storage regulator CsrA
MLVITRKDGEGIDFDCNGVRGRIRFECLRGKVKVMFDAPTVFHVVRSELQKEVKDDATPAAS